MNLQLNGKVALVTGSTVGIGFAIAKSLHDEGAEVILNGRSKDRVNEARERLRDSASPAAVHELVADLTTDGGVRILQEQFPAVDILVNNLGVYEAKPLSEIAPEDWERMFSVNVVSGARLSQFYLPKMKAKGAGRVLFIASESGVNIPPDMIHYGVSKAAQIALARGLAETTAGTGVTVNTVLPGPTYSEGVDRFLKDVIGSQAGDRSKIESEFLTRMRPTSLIRRFATAEEVASLVTYLASPLSSATNGAALRVEGGLLRGVL